MSPTRRDFMRRALTVTAGAALAAPHVADAARAADVPALPPSPVDVYVLLFGPDGLRGYGLIGVAPGVDGGPPRVMVPRPDAELTAEEFASCKNYRRVVDASAEPDTYAATVTLIAAALAAVDADVLPKAERP